MKVSLVVSQECAYFVSSWKGLLGERSRNEIYFIFFRIISWKRTTTVMKLYENQYMCMKTNMHGNHNASTPGLATHQRLRDLVRMGSGSSWPGTTQVIVMIRIKIVEILLAFAWVLCVNSELMWMNTTIFLSQEWACAKKRRARTTKWSLWREEDARTDSQHIIFSQNFSRYRYKKISQF